MFEDLLELPRPDLLRLMGRQFGPGNGRPMRNPFWEMMVRQRQPAHWARTALKVSGSELSPVWCFARFGRTVTALDDGSLVYVGGEHEDFYDQDFCIYNDVIVERTSGAIEIYGFPPNDLPPTDFHTATLVEQNLYLIGSLGSPHQRAPDATPVYRLDTRNFEISPVRCGGDRPGWIFKHRAEFDHRARAIRIWGGKLYRSKEQPREANPDTYELDLASRKWRRL